MGYDTNTSKESIARHVRNISKYTCHQTHGASNSRLQKCRTHVYMSKATYKHQKRHTVPECRQTDGASNSRLEKCRTHVYILYLSAASESPPHRKKLSADFNGTCAGSPSAPLHSAATFRSISLNSLPPRAPSPPPPPPPTSSLCV